MKKNVRFFCILFVMLLFLGIWTEKLFHYSFEKSILSAFQRIDYQPSKFTKRITIIDTSPIYDFTAHRTNRKALADVLSAIQLGQPQIIGLDIRLERDSLHQDCFGDSILKNKNGNWQNNKLLKSIDDDFKVLEEIGDQETEISKQLQNLGLKPGWSARFSYYSLKWLSWRPFRRFIKFFTKDVSMLDNDVIKHRFGEVKQLIQLRNRMVHSGGVFMDNEEYQKIQPRFEIWLKEFLFDKFKFWHNVKLIQELNQDRVELDLELGGKKYRLTPFFLQATCSVHLKEELFLLSVIDEKKGRLTYEGKEQTCRLVIEGVAERCDQILKFFEVES